MQECATSVEQDVLTQALAAKQAASTLMQTTSEERNAALQALANALREHSEEIVLANAQDVKNAREKDVKESLIDRLLLNAERVESMALALEDLIALPDPLGKILEERELYNGLELRKVSVPLGVVAVIYEARPNVTADAAGICLKSGNACVLRGGSLAAGSNKAIASVLSAALASCGLPAAAITYIQNEDRSATNELMQLHGVIDVLVPRGGAGLIAHCVEHSKVPVIETGTGNCHIYVHGSADFTMAADIVKNAKCRRYGVCNAAETLLVDEAAIEALPQIAEALLAEGVQLHCDERSYTVLTAYIDEKASATPVQGDVSVQDAANSESKVQDAHYKALIGKATEYDWETEYLAPEMAVKVVADIQEAIIHINTYGTKHSEAIIAEDTEAQKLFFAAVDASCVYANASTSFTDGGQFGLGAEIGISTQKLHVRGPFALEGLTSTKYLIQGSGQVRA